MRIKLGDNNLEINGAVPDLKNFYDRLFHGKNGECTVGWSFERNIIENKGFLMAPAVDSNSKISKDINAINGDIYFYHPFTLNLEFVDVKAGNFVSDRSMRMFTKNGWFFINAFVLSRKMQYMMIRNNEALYEWVQQFKYNQGYKINFIDLPPDPPKYGLELYRNMDPLKYKKLILDVRSILDKSGMPYREIIKEVD